MDRVKGKVALISGGASGLGRQSARRLAEEGARVVVADLNETGGTAVAKELGAAGRFVPLDVTKEDDWARAIQVTLDTFGRLDVLVNSAGVGNMNSVEDCTLEEWKHVMAVNGDGVFLGCKHGIGAIKRTAPEPGAGGGLRSPDRRPGPAPPTRRDGPRGPGLRARRRPRPPCAAPGGWSGSSWPPPR